LAVVAGMKQGQILGPSLFLYVQC